MATATVARPQSAIRKSRDVPRLSLSKRQTSMSDNVNGTGDGPASKKRKLDEPFVRTSSYILKKHQGKPPSMTIHIHDGHFRFDGQDGSFSYDSPMRFIVEHLREQTVPHEMLEELHKDNVPFYDGCLIVEVHNHRSAEKKENGKKDSDSGPGGTVKFSMHNYNEHVTPSPMVPYPSKARTDSPESAASKMQVKVEEQDKGKKKEGPKIATIVLHPTALSQHHEILLLARTPAVDVRSRKRSADGSTPSSAVQPPTPQLSSASMSLGQTGKNASGQPQKMALEAEDFYKFQADMLVATEPPLYLEPVRNLEECQKVLDMMSNPLHSHPAPSPKTRKRTTAEMAADDAQAAEIERRMLIMDERIKPNGTSTAANENQATAASLGFSRFKTLELVRQQHEEKERIKKDEQARAAVEKKQQEEQQAQQLQRMQQEAQMQRQMLSRQAQAQAAAQQANPNAAAMAREQQMARARMQQAQANAQAQAQIQAQAQAQAQMNAQNHPHAQQGNMMQGQQQGQQQNFQHPNQAAMQQSPVVRNPTPLINSSPPMAQNGFPMAPSNSQGAGSPQRPNSAAVQRPNMMARQVSQQQHPSRNVTPQLPQGTPNMAQAVPNRQMSQTPRLQPGSPAAAMQQGTPTSGNMQMQSPQIANMNNLTPEQQMILQQRAQMGQGQQNMSPEQFAQFTSMQNMQRVQMQRQMMMQQQQQQQQGQMPGQQGQFTPAQQMQQRQLLAQQQQLMRQRQAAMQRQASGAGGQAGTPGSMPQQQQQTPQMGHAGSPVPMQQQNSQMGHPHAQQQQQHQQQQQQQQQMDGSGGGGGGGGGGGPQNMTQQRMLEIQRQNQAQLSQHMRPLMAQYGSVQNIPPEVRGALPQHIQNLLNQHMAARQRNLNAQRLQQQQQQQHQGMGGGPGGGNNGAGNAGGNNQEQVPGSAPNPSYMQNLRNSANAMLGAGANNNNANVAQQVQMVRQQQRQVQQQQQQQHQQGGGGGVGAGGDFGMGGPMGMGQQFNSSQNNANDLSQHFARMQNVIQQQGGQGGNGMQ